MDSKLDMEIEEHRLKTAEAKLKTEQSRHNRWKLFFDAVFHENVLTAGVISLALILGFGLAAYGCKRTTDLDANLAPLGYKVQGHEVVPLEEK